MVVYHGSNYFGDGCRMLVQYSDENLPFRSLLIIPVWLGGWVPSELGNAKKECSRCIGQRLGRRVVFSDVVRGMGVIHFTGYQIYLGWEFLVWDFGRPEWKLPIGCAESCIGSRSPLAKIVRAFDANLLYSIDVSARRYTLGVHYKDYNANRAPLDIVPNMRPRPGAVELSRGRIGWGIFPIFGAGLRK